MIFDRVRERLGRRGRGAIEGAVNAAVLALYLFGGRALESFAFTLLVGIAAGTWSTVFVAAPVAARLALR